MIKREMYMKQIRPFMNKDIVKVLSGIRRCGKSIMMDLIQQELQDNHISKSCMLSINFESLSLPFEKNIRSIYAYIKDFCVKDASKKYVFLDEIQELPNWQKLINSLLIDFNVDIYITGSNAKLLSGELATYLAGRYIEIKVYPFSYAEVMQIMKETNPQLTDSEIFNHYLKLGGMPFIYQNDLEYSTSIQYLNDVFNSIIVNDIIERNKIRDVALCKKVLAYIISEISHTYSASSITKYLKNERRSISTETIYNYIDYCMNACFLHLVSRQDLKGKNILSFQEKIYITDHGFKEALYANNEKNIEQTLENIVYIELLRRGYNVTVGKNNQYEIDFCAEKAGKIMYVQVSYLLANQQTIDREFGNLLMIQDNYPKYVVSMDEIDRSQKGIIHKNIKDFLLMKSYD